jgi:DNA replication and repair protein RecF
LAHWIHRDPGRDALSRGQAKLTALALLLSQARLHAGLAGEWPVIALDDLASELDRAHQARVVDDLVATGAQVFVTGTDAPEALQAHAGSLVHVHVEEGRLRPERAGTLTRVRRPAAACV